YIPRAFSDLRGDKKGVMARICDLQAALRLIEKVPDGDTIVDPLGVCDGKVLRRTSDESLPEKTASAIDVADLTKAIFSNKRGYLADRY
ncbi:MAG: hypothetical protein IJ735_04215, partial [Clostridia bacterium]|nr:hypothetical protein [Clostridia bacterium]